MIVLPISEGVFWGVSEFTGALGMLEEWVCCPRWRFGLVWELVNKVIVLPISRECSGGCLSSLALWACWRNGSAVLAGASGWCGSWSTGGRFCQYRGSPGGCLCPLAFWGCGVRMGLLSSQALRVGVGVGQQVKRFADIEGVGGSWRSSSCRKRHRRFCEGGWNEGGWAMLKIDGVTLRMVSLF